MRRDEARKRGGKGGEGGKGDKKKKEKGMGEGVWESGHGGRRERERQRKGDKACENREGNKSVRKGKGYVDK